MRDARRGRAPEVVLHLAAQPLVRRSYDDPRETFEVNVMGTVNVLDAVRADGGRARRSSTSRRTSATRTASGSGPTARTSRWAATTRTRARKGAPELVTARLPALVLRRAGRRRGWPRARAGNVIGGGDWGADRLMPDVVRAPLAGEPVASATRDAIAAVAARAQPAQRLPRLAQRAVGRARASPAAWNFGPARGRRAARAAGSSSASPSCWPGGLRLGRATRASTRTRPATCKIDSSRAAGAARLGAGWDLDERARRDRRLVRGALRDGADMRAA